MKKGMIRLAAMATATVWLAGCGESAPPEPPPRPVRVTTVQFAQTATTARYSGEIRARHESPLAFQVGGRLVNRLVDVGSPVARGQVLAILDQGDVRLDEIGSAAQLAAAQAELEQARKDFRHLDNLHAQELASQAALDTRRDRLTAAEARVAAARAAQGLAARKSGYAELRAEQAGVVTVVEAEPGQVMAAGQSVLRLAQTSEKEAVISVPENRLQDVRTASAIRVNLWARPDRFYAGRVREVSPGVDAVLRTYTVKISMPEAGDEVGMGMTATVLVQRDEAQPVAWLPLTALTQDGGRPAVWVYDAAGGTVQPRQVTLAGYDDEHGKLLAGVADGDKVVTAGVHKLTPGQKVRLLEPQP
ncbi:MAG: efflux RND transporter periplasmic adaptor subunit [Methylococcales bacterium]|nr:efflux RND transporter periplasmic adaptor subunit [Methylococcales bacterium]